MSLITISMPHIVWSQQMNCVSNSQNKPFYQSDLDPVTLILKLDLDMVNVVTLTDVSMSMQSKVIVRKTDR